ncbi:MAG: iron-sulfur cluster assembly scaffold protein [Candidatus Uhrbacteria bacterium]
MSDVTNTCNTEAWFYSDIVKDHFFKPRNFLKEENPPADFNAYGVYGSPACGDEMKVWLKIDPETKKIVGYLWKTFGCASAIAAASICSVICLEGEGTTIDEAVKITPQMIVDRLGGLPPRKIHCSVLCDKALRNVINNFVTNHEIG